ncbi:hypothetical protein BS50DRAFT_584451 [Corynespora cassiicola Philippines]|uniref:Uncharacterized protein n=1 Tax=Corynespora cassiicola Philippines TaxID=1448308 RepID=A0A2T2NZM2_CORCC|nr:hypothetical protein BS50DRAFT_584451 [Corynespora cassiicola Philippines]
MDPNQNSHMLSDPDAPVGARDLTPGSDIDADAIFPKEYVCLNNIPKYDYMYSGTENISFTMVEIIVFLPNLFHDASITERLLNNGLQTTVHSYILKNFRWNTERITQGLSTSTIKKNNSKAMKGRYGDWSVSSHVKPHDWDWMNISMNGFVPNWVLKGETQEYGSSIPFQTLIRGVKKLPEGYDSADLTRALRYTLENPRWDMNGQLVEYLFPDDLQNILNITGRTEVTMAHTDGQIIMRYREKMRHEIALARTIALGEKPNTPQTPPKSPESNPVAIIGLSTYHTPYPESPKESDTGCSLATYSTPDPGSSRDAEVNLGQSTYSMPDSYPTNIDPNLPVYHTPASEQWGLSEADSTESGTTPELEHYTNSDADSPFMTGTRENTEEHQISNPTGILSHGPKELLRECMEAFDPENLSDLAVAARIALQPDQIGVDWFVEDTEFLLSISAMAAYNSG